SRHARHLGAFPLWPMLEIAPVGRGFHSGGTFPMSARPVATQTDVLGRPAGWQRVHVVDATVLPSIPATTITFSVMANAHRIGWQKVLRAAREAKVDHVVYVSSVSAFDECRSLYGRAKLETERIARSLGAIVIRPGLIWGDPPGATFGRLVARVERARVLPLFGGGRQIQYLVHDQDLTHFICECAEGHTSPGSAPVTIAHEHAWTFRQ